MVKHFMAIMVALFIMSSNCLAMTFYKPQEVGSFAESQIRSGFIIKGATAATESPYYYSGDSTPYFRSSNGVVRFGDEADDLYLYYGSGNNVRVGGSDINNTIALNDNFGEIFKMNSDSGYTFYIIKKANDVPCPYDTYTIVGRTPNSSWVQIFRFR